MADQHIKGTVSRARGRIEETAGKLTGDRRTEAKGKLRQVQGKAQQGLGDVQDVVDKARKEP
ncbi:MAG: CsbD family protein [Chloroflexi bacterium]|nr:CsbD family protein [Chloroflexota bacterium]